MHTNRYIAYVEHRAKNIIIYRSSFFLCYFIEYSERVLKQMYYFEDFISVGFNLTVMYYCHLFQTFFFSFEMTSNILIVSLAGVILQLCLTSLAQGRYI